MRSTMLAAALLLCASSLGLGPLGCEPPSRNEGAYEEGGGNQRVNLPEDARRSPDARGVEMNVDTGEQGEYEPLPGRQEESTPQAGATDVGAGSSDPRDRTE